MLKRDFVQEVNFTQKVTDNPKQIFLIKYEFNMSFEFDLVVSPDHIQKNPKKTSP